MSYTAFYTRKKEIIWFTAAPIIITSVVAMAINIWWVYFLLTFLIFAIAKYYEQGQFDKDKPYEINFGSAALGIVAMIALGSYTMLSQRINPFQTIWLLLNQPDPIIILGLVTTAALLISLALRAICYWVYMAAWLIVVAVGMLLEDFTWLKSLVSGFFDPELRIRLLNAVLLNTVIVVILELIQAWWLFIVAVPFIFGIARLPSWRMSNNRQQTAKFVGLIFCFFLIARASELQLGVWWLPHLVALEVGGFVAVCYLLIATDFMIKHVLKPMMQGRKDL